MVIESARPGRGASDRAARLSYFRISGVEWLYAIAVVLACAMAALVSVGPLTTDLAGVLARLTSPLGVTVGAVGLLASGRRVRGRHRRTRTAEPVELTAWRWVGSGLLVLAGAGWLRTANDLELWAGLSEVDGVQAVSVAGFALVASGTALIPRLPSSRHGRLRALADGMAGAVALGVLGWELVAVSVTGGERTALALVVVMSTALGAAMFTELRGGRHVDGAFRWFEGGLSGLVAVEMLALSGYPVGFPSTIAHSIGLASAAMILVTVIAVRQPRVESQSIGAIPASKLAIPYVPVAGLLALGGYRLAVGAAGVSLPAAGLIAVAVLFAIGQMAASREQRALVETERDRMVASVSHELKTPLTAVAGFSYLLATEWAELDDHQRLEMVRTIRDQSGTLVGMVSDMVSLVGDRMHSVELDVRQVDGKALIAGVVRSMFGPEGSSIAVRTRIEPYLEVMCDRERLEQVIGLLLDNARRYGVGQILIDGHRQGAWRVIEIHDDGPGLTESEEEIVWERFRRGGGDSNARVPGAGLGLSKARALARAHEGEVTYRRSDELGGACFSIRLPLDRDQVGPSTAAPVPSTFPPRADRIHSGLPGPVHGRFGPSPALSRRQSLPYLRMSTGGDA